MAIIRPKRKRKRRPSKRSERKAKQPATIPTRFEPKFWTDADNRQRIIRRIKDRVARLKKEAGADSMQKELLCERAIFIATRMETLELEALEGGEFNGGSYTQMANALSGLLSKLGLNKTAFADPWTAADEEDD